MKITPLNQSGSHRTGTLHGITKEQIIEVLGFGPNVDDDSYKVVNSWGFKAMNMPFGIWDYKGSHKLNTWSCYGDHEVFKKLFGAYYSFG